MGGMGGYVSGTVTGTTLTLQKDNHKGAAGGSVTLILLIFNFNGMENPKYTITKDTAGQFRFVLRAKNGEIILRASQGYSSNSGCRNGIASCQKNSPYDSSYERKNSASYTFSFNLKAGNWEVIGVSESYTTSSGRENGIDACKRDGSTQSIEDLS
jgi:uncharacterized protein YegP (UPF0339 family)